MLIRSAVMAFSLTGPAAYAQETPLRDPANILCDIVETAKGAQLDLSGLHAQFEGEEYIIHYDGDAVSSDPSLNRLSYPKDGFESDLFADIMEGLGQNHLQTLNNMGFSSDALRTVENTFNVLAGLSNELDQSLTAITMPSQGNTIKPDCRRMGLS